LTDERLVGAGPGLSLADFFLLQGHSSRRKQPPSVLHHFFRLDDMPMLTRRQLKRVLAVTQDKIDEDASRTRRALRASRMSRIELGAELIRMWDGIVEAQNTGDRLQNELREENQKLREELRALWAAHYNLQEETFGLVREVRELRAQMPPAIDDELFGEP
jgi:hypothetical protein